ncbi:Protein phosphatase 1 regulatory subunit pprA [Tetrabaena socialis]|uniref:Protein phosphatase 1 regulatory subunit pprA n=1 Tax=Tetrabaena socialis TaxID=47790 RepID=A0A2J8A2K2_9CHLO|nr:Protein phosphatase 1 regulatory subunit pprA [Tetrabaena socialis]|eukprot:PNH06744.1 Protein phosphatase 1 regulatory subunit pprA [Tetrabaena socialis]
MPAEAGLLDLTNSHLTDLSGVEIDPSLTAIDLTANRLRTIDPRILALQDLHTINFRQNLLVNVSAWSGCSCKGALEDLEFRDNHLSNIPDLNGFTKLRRLECSYNQIRNLIPLSDLDSPALEELYVASNKVTAITALSHLTSLTLLELGSNRIRVVENLESLTALRELWLGRNRISKVEGLATLTALRRISLQSNRLTSMAGLEACTALEELYLSHNGIQRLEGLGPLARLKMLDVSSNRLTALQPDDLASQTELEDLWLNDNQLPAVDAALDRALEPVRQSLTCLYLEGNPAASDTQYKRKLTNMLPKLKQRELRPLKGADGPSGLALGPALQLYADPEARDGGQRRPYTPRRNLKNPVWDPYSSAVYMGEGHAILRLSSDGTVTVVAGPVEEAGDADGPGRTARFSYPGHLVSDGAGSLYAAQRACVRKLQLPLGVGPAADQRDSLAGGRPAAALGAATGDPVGRPPAGQAAVGEGEVLASTLQFRALDRISGLAFDGGVRSSGSSGSSSSGGSSSSSSGSSSSCGSNSGNSGSLLFSTKTALYRLPLADPTAALLLLAGVEDYDEGALHVLGLGLKLPRCHAARAQPATRVGLPPRTLPADLRALLGRQPNGTADVAIVVGDPALAAGVAELADRLLLPELRDLAMAVVEATVSAVTVAGLLLWAEACGPAFSELLSRLKAWYVDNHEAMLREAKEENLELLTALRELWLGRNRISKVEGLATLTALRRISLQSNRLTSMTGLEACTALEELYLSHNGIQRLEGLGPLARLKMLDISSNRLTALQPDDLASQTELEDLWLNDNQLPAVDAALDRTLEPVRQSLTRLYLEGNPAASDTQYKRKLTNMLPKLKQTQTLVICSSELRPLEGADGPGGLALGPALQLHAHPAARDGGQRRSYTPRGNLRNPVWDPCTSAVYMCEGQAILRLSSDDTVTVVAGAVEGEGDTDGPGRTARFRGPRFLVSDGAGSLYAAQRACVRRLQLLPGVGPVAGQRGTLVGGAPVAALGTAAEGPAGGPPAGQAAVGEIEVLLVSTLPFRAASNILGLAFDGDGSSSSLLFMTLTALYRLPLGDPTAAPLLLAGAEGMLGATDGRGSDARFHEAVGIVLDGEGSTYMADWPGDDTTSVRRVTPDGTVTTVVAGLEGNGLVLPAILPNGCLALINDDEEGLRVLGLGLKLPRCHAARALPAAPAGPLPRTLPEVALGWVYTDTADIPAALAAGVAELADRLLLAELRDQALAVVEATVSAVTVVEMLLWAVAAESRGLAFSELLSRLKGCCSIPIGSCAGGVVTRILPGGRPGEAALTQTLVAGGRGLRPLTGADGPSGLSLGPALQLYADPAARDGEPAVARRPYTPRDQLRDPVWDPYSSAVYMGEGHAILRLASDGTVTVVAGAVEEAGDADGPGGTARFREPRYLVLDGAGSLYAAQGPRVRKLQLPPGVGPVAGQQGSLAGGIPAAALGRAAEGPVGGAPASLTAVGEAGVLVSTLPFRASDSISGLAFDGGVRGSGSSGSSGGNGSSSRNSGSSGSSGGSGSLLFSTETALYRLPLADPTAALLLLAGAEGEASIVDGRGADARFSSIWGIVLDGEGSVYMPDWEDQDTTKLRRVTVDGIVTTAVVGLEGLIGLPAILPNGCLALNDFKGDTLHVVGLGLKLPRCHTARALPAAPVGLPPRTLPADLRALLGRQLDGTADVAIAVGDRTFHMHRALLSARSDYFQRLFGGGFADGSAQQLSLPDADADAFEVVLCWVYTGTADIPAALAAGVAELADRQLLPELRDLALAVVEATVSTVTVAGLLLWAEATEALGPAFSELLSRLKAWYVENHEAVLREAKEEVGLLAVRSPGLMLQLMCGMSTKPPKRMRTG